MAEDLLYDREAATTALWRFNDSPLDLVAVDFVQLDIMGGAPMVAEAHERVRQQQLTLLAALAVDPITVLTKSVTNAIAASDQAAPDAEAAGDTMADVTIEEATDATLDAIEIVVTPLVARIVELETKNCALENRLVELELRKAARTEVAFA